jgi:mannose-1-phosphate guanylyltransferase
VAVHKVVRFREKPDAATAEEFLRAGTFVWNAGIFVWKAATVLDALRKFCPEVAAGIDRIAAAPKTIVAEYPTIKKVPIDKAVMEKAPNVKVLEVAYDWSDVGDWRALAALIPADDRGNTIDGPVRVVDTKDSIIVADEGKLICALGVEGLVIVQSGGATLVARRDDLDKLKKLVEGLAEAGHAELL